MASLFFLGSRRRSASSCIHRQVEKAYPKDPKSLLKARYEAFEKADVDYILETHHPETRDQVDREAIRNWAEQSNWLGLEIGELVDHKDHAHLEFTARYERDHQTFNHTEIAEFRMHDGRWYYYDSEFPSPATIRRDGDKVGRNDPCPCGSGKKFKKCHAA